MNNFIRYILHVGGPAAVIGVLMTLSFIYITMDVEDSIYIGAFAFCCAWVAFSIAYDDREVTG